MRLATLVAAAAMLPSVSFAQSCPAPYTVDALLGDLVSVEGALRGGDAATANTGAKKLEAGLACLNEVLPLMVVGKTMRAVGAGFYVGGDTMTASRWLNTAAEVDSTFSYGTQDLPEGHPLVQAWEDAKSVAGDPTPVSGKALADGIHYLDGRKIDAPIARPDRVHLYQVDSGTVSSYLIVGNAFPEERLKGAATAAATKPPKEKKTKGGSSEDAVDAALAGESTVYKRIRPPEKTPLIIAGGALIGGAGVLYGLSFGTAGQFNDATTEEDIKRLQGATNQLVLISGAVLAVGIGVETWGIMVSGNGAPMPAVRFRF